MTASKRILRRVFNVGATDVRIHRTRIITAVLVLALAGAAQAADLFTPPLTMDSEFLRCEIVNLSSTSRAVTIEVRNSSGTVLGSPLIIGNLQPHGVASTSQSNPAGVRPSYCKFVVEGAKSNYRASGCIADATECTAAAVPAK